MNAEGGEAAPGGVAASELDRARREHEAKEQPDEEKSREPGRGEAGTDPPPGGRRQEDREEPGLGEKKVPLELEERLAGDGEGEIEQPRRGGAPGGHEAGEEQERRAGSGRALQVEGGVARRDPGQRRQEPVTIAARVCADPVQQRRDRQDTVRANEPVDLDPQRYECGEIAEAEQAQKERGRGGVRRLQYGGPPEQARDRRRGGPVIRDEAVRQLGQRSGAGDAAIESEPGPASGLVPGQRGDGFRSAEHLAVGKDELECASEALFRNLRKSFGDLLRGRIVHFRTRPRFPARDPEPAETAISVENRERTLRRLRNARDLAHRARVYGCSKSGRVFALPSARGGQTTCPN